MTATINKIFGIGLSKTGTTSLNAALCRLGFPSVHWPIDPRTLDELKTGQFRLSIMQKYVGLTDLPAVPFYRQYDRVFPGSKFILTVRDKAAWLDSADRHFNRKLESNKPRVTQARNFLRVAVYGCFDFQPDHYSDVYDRHVDSVRTYFADRPDDLLEIDICAGQGWERLCPFLGVAVPDRPFPHVNKWGDQRQRPDRSAAPQAPQRLVDVLAAPPMPSGNDAPLNPAGPADHSE